MADYLPQNASSTKAMEVMQDEFGGDIANTRVMLKDVDIQEALAVKEEIAAIDGVAEVMWLDDVIDLTIPIEMADQDTVESYYIDGNALFTFYVEKGKEVAVTDQIYEVIGPDNAMAGEAVDAAVAQKMTGKETLNATLILMPILIIILILSTRSWLEPLFYLIAIGIAVLINLGTHIFIGEISFISQAVAPILQLAVSLDYAIFLMHSFDDYRRKLESPVEAMKKAMKHSFSAIIACASTTFLGFLALTFMDFEIGADLGLSLVKGILLSFLSVMVFLPAFTLMFYRFLDKTQHRQFIPNRFQIGHFVMKTRVPVLLIVFMIVIPAFLAQSNTNFMYGMGDMPENTRSGRDTIAIEEAFGKYTPMVLLVEKGDLAKEEALVAELQDLNEVKSVVSYTNTVGIVIPPEYLDDTIVDQFLSDHYSRIILNTTTDSEGEEAFALVEKVQAITANYYDDFHAVGESITLYDMKEVVEKDNTLVNALTIITMAIVLLVIYRSFSLPVVLLLVIQTAVWINLSVPYFTDDPLVYIGYLIVSIVQLAATIDYAILFSDDYMNNRKGMTAKEAIQKTINEKTFSIAVPASILTSVGVILAWTSSNPIISAIGLLLGRGTVLAFILVVFLLPALLVLFDRLIAKTTLNAKFYEGK